jgi:ubiquinone/menaquinone biosynthesis C-methylase UbiE
MRLRALLLGGVGGAALLGGAWWWRTHPSPCPYSQRLWVQAPHPIITRTRLLQVLDPKPDDHVLELGPGTGYYTLPVARELRHGRLTIVDIQPEMLDHTMRRAAEAAIDNIASVRADAEALPFSDGTFDAAYTVTTLGEVPDPDQALRELARVLKPSGRLVVGELLLGDPHMVTFSRLRTRAHRAGLRIERRIGSFLGYFALLRRNSV